MTYLVDPWVDGLPRWVAQHIVLGWWLGGAFVDGESIADAEARVGQTIGPVQLKLKLNAPYSGVGGKVVTVSATRAVTGVTDTLTATVLPGAQTGAIFPLAPHPHSDGPPARWYTDVTNITASGDGDLRAKVVNLGPSWRSSNGVIVKHQAYSPFACDVRLTSRDPDLAVDFMGRLHVVYCRDGAVIHRIQNADGRWEDAVDVTASARLTGSHSNPSVVPESTGRIVVSADRSSTANTLTNVCESEDDGQHWEQIG